ncbi:hypothetical protein XENORESO_021173 [Xenotaenia resolanae]|uniref:Secreted protein n=1 Tax=Xenotaenia resolanae TaxID=208358 RepID=A0ABV0X0Q4_9TELE
MLTRSEATFCGCVLACSCARPSARSWSAFQLCERQVAVRSHSPAFWQHHGSATLGPHAGPLRAAESGEAPLRFMGTDADGSAALGTLNTWVVSRVFSFQSMC